MVKKSKPQDSYEESDNSDSNQLIIEEKSQTGEDLIDIDSNEIEQNEQNEIQKDWGKDKQGYYQESDETLSEDSDEQKEAEQIQKQEKEKMQSSYYFDDEDAVAVNQDEQIEDEGDLISTLRFGEEQQSLVKHLVSIKRDISRFLQAGQVSELSQSKKNLYFLKQAELIAVLSYFRLFKANFKHLEYQLSQLQHNDLEVDQDEQIPIEQPLITLKKVKSSETPKLAIAAPTKAAQKRKKKKKQVNFLVDQEEDEDSAQRVLQGNNRKQSKSETEEEQVLNEKSFDELDLDQIKLDQAPEEVERNNQIYNEKKHLKEFKKANKQIKKIEIQEQTQEKVKKAFKQREIDDNQARMINQQILKNKGLTRKRKKIDRNSRVKLRRKYDTALTKLKSIGVLPVRQQKSNYQGENGIKITVKKGTSLKDNKAF